MLKIRNQIVLTGTATALTGTRVQERCNSDSRILEVMVHFPPGCVALVDVALGHSGKQFCPQNGYMPLDNATPIFTFNNEDVKIGELIWMDIINRDAMNPHTITATITMEEV